MLVAYILTKSKFLRVKFVKLQDSGVFKHGDFEYRIDRKRIYQKKFLFFKLFFWSMYLEGVTDPLEFNDLTYEVKELDTPLDEIAILLRKIRNGIFDVIIVLAVVFNLILTGYLIYMLNEIQKMM